MGKHFGHSGSTVVGSLGRIFFGLILGLVVYTEDVAAMTYFLSPTGDDSNTGVTRTSPWKTFNFAIPSLLPGDTLILLDGTYDASNSGFPVLNINGTAAQPITIKALNERKAHIHNEGTRYSVTGSKCSYLTFEGVQASSEDNPGVTGSNGGGFHFTDCHHLVFKRLLLHHNNRYANSHPLVLIRVTDSLVEESEFYYFHRHAIPITSGGRIIVRRVYCNSRGYGQIPGGRNNSHGTVGGDICVSLYPANDSIVENTIADATTGGVFDIQASGPTNADNNRFLGNIALQTQYGAVIKARVEPGATALAMPKNNVVNNFVAYGPEEVGIFIRGVRAQRCDHCLLLNSSRNAGLIVDVEPVAPGDGVYSFFSDNSLSLSNDGPGFMITNQIQTWTVNNANSFGNQLNYSPQSSANYLAIKSVDSLLGACRVWIPDNSPLKRAGKNGKDIGANILYRYQDGVLTNVPLWNPTTGEFPRGALVAGLNDVAGQSLFDVHKRLNVNTNGCSFPANYGDGVTDVQPPSAPRSLAIF